MQVLGVCNYCKVNIHHIKHFSITHDGNKKIFSISSDRREVNYIPTESFDQKREEMLASCPWYHLLFLDFKTVQNQTKNILYIYILDKLKKVLEFSEKTSPG